ncbi:MAG: hypothetical protein E5V63_32170 [Mesorhizobium sp.]|nr:MAG: hypothetical protein E5V63_32170 [Mesorhizobium sp.]
MLGDGYWSRHDKWLSAASFLGGRPSQDMTFSLEYRSKRVWNEFHFFNEKFNQVLVQARSELDAHEREKPYADIALIGRDQGGLIIPMSNDFIDATGRRLGRGWQPRSYARLRAVHGSRPEALRP